MIELKPTRKFTHGGETYRRGDVLKVRDQRQAEALAAKGLVDTAKEAPKADKAATKKEASKPAKKKAD